MTLMISETALRDMPLAAPTVVTLDIISYATGECALGRVLVARSVKGICAILIGADHDELEADLAVRSPQARLVASEAAAHDDLVKVIRFVDKPAAIEHVPFRVDIGDELAHVGHHERLGWINVEELGDHVRRSLGGAEPPSLRIGADH